jgi:hypothetical protein
VAPALTDRPDADERADEPKPWSRSAKVQLLVILAIGAFWIGIYAYTLLSGPHRPIGQMTDTSFATAAEPICAATAEDIEALGLPTAVESPAERATLVLAENDLLRTMVGELGRLDRPRGEEGEWTTEWLADWAVHIEDRERWADDLQAGDDHPFVETARQNEQISKGVDFFAETNDMPSCATAGDV